MAASLGGETLFYVQAENCSFELREYNTDKTLNRSGDYYYIDNGPVSVVVALTWTPNPGYAVSKISAAKNGGTPEVYNDFSRLKEIYFHTSTSQDVTDTYEITITTAPPFSVKLEGDLNVTGKINGVKDIQPKVSGTEGQVAGFDKDGNLVPQDAAGTGKTAYQYAVDGGYTGTEEEFQKLMGTGPWLPLTGGTMTGSITLPNTISDTTPAIRSYQSSETAGQPCLKLYKDANNCSNIRFGHGASSPAADKAVIIRGVAAPVNSDDAANKEYVDSKAGGVPSGVIAMWSGAASNIPSGWVLCNGQNGTPDLRDRFIVGAGSSYGVGATGGSAQVTLTVAQMPSHAHTTAYGVGISNAFSFSQQYGYSGQAVLNDVGSNYTGGSQAHENRPPYYALCFIMKQ